MIGHRSSFNRYRSSSESRRGGRAGGKAGGRPGCAPASSACCRLNRSLFNRMIGPDLILFDSSTTTLHRNHQPEPDYHRMDPRAPPTPLRQSPPTRIRIPKGRKLKSRISDLAQPISHLMIVAFASTRELESLIAVNDESRRAAL